MNALTKDVNELPIPLEHVRTVAKYMVYGISASAICESFDLSQDEFATLQTHPVFLQLKDEAQGATAKRDVETDEGWDDLEHKALGNLAFALKFNKDPDLNLRVAAVANKAIRRVRNTPRVLDGNQGTRIPLVLTERIVQKFASGDSIAEERKISVNIDKLNPNGRPDMNAVNALLGRRRVKDEIIDMEIPTHESPRVPNNVSTSPSTAIRQKTARPKSLFEISFDTPLDGDIDS